MKEPAEITPLLERAQSGDGKTMDEVAQRVHADLSRLARRLTAREERRGRGPLTLETSALVNKTFIKLLQQRGRDKRGSRAIRVSLSALGAKEAIPASMAMPDLEAAFASLESADPRAARVARLRILWGLDHDWRFASAWIKVRR